MTPTAALQTPFHAVCRDCPGLEEFDSDVESVAIAIFEHKMQQPDHRVAVGAFMDGDRGE